MYIVYIWYAAKVNEILKFIKINLRLIEYYEVCFKCMLIRKVLPSLNTYRTLSKHIEKLSTCLSKLELSGAVKINVLFLFFFSNKRKIY